MFSLCGSGDSTFGSHPPAPAETVWNTLYLSRTSILERHSFWQYSKYTTRGLQSPVPNMLRRPYITQPPHPQRLAQPFNAWPPFMCDQPHPSYLYGGAKHNFPLAPFSAGQYLNNPFHPRLPEMTSFCFPPNNYSCNKQMVKIEPKEGSFPERLFSKDRDKPTGARSETISQKKRDLFTAMEKFLIKIAEFYNKLHYLHCYSPSHYKMAVTKLLSKSRNLFYELESNAIKEILDSSSEWDSIEELIKVFHHDYLLLADNLAVNILQLVLTYSEYGFISVDQDNPLSVSSFYRGEIRLGRVLPGVYQMHVTSLQYTTLTNLLQLSPCPLEHLAIHHHTDRMDLSSAASSTSSDICEEASFDLNMFKQRDTDVDVDLLADDLDELPMTSEEIEETSNFLKILRWRVRFLQNPDLEEENYYLCCKAVRPLYHQPEYMLQLDSVQYVFGKLSSPKMNFTDPSIDEISLVCRPVGRFKVLHSFGRSLPNYASAIAVLVDYLRHKRFRRTVF